MAVLNLQPLWLVAAFPTLVLVAVLVVLLRPLRRPRVQRDDRNWRGVHRTRHAPGRHSPARGKRLEGLSRQAQLEERTVSVSAAALREEIETWCNAHEPYRDGVRIRCRTCGLDLPQPEGMPEIGQHGFQSWA